MPATVTCRARLTFSLPLLLPLQVRQMRSTDRREKIAVVVGTVTNDVRILELPKLKVSTGI